jgi:hypothetical protein
VTDGRFFSPVTVYKVTGGQFYGQPSPSRHPACHLLFRRKIKPLADRVTSVTEKTSFAVNLRKDPYMGTFIGR